MTSIKTYLSKLRKFYEIAKKKKVYFTYDKSSRSDSEDISRSL